MILYDAGGNPDKLFRELAGLELELRRQLVGLRFK